jgi:hypothetical protein
MASPSTSTRRLSEAEHAQRRARDRELTVRAVAQLRTSDGWQAWLRVRARTGLRRYSLIISRRLRQRRGVGGLGRQRHVADEGGRRIPSEASASDSRCCILLRRSSADSEPARVIFAFGATPTTREQVEDLPGARPACCRSLSIAWRRLARGALHDHQPRHRRAGRRRGGEARRLLRLPDHAGAGYAGLLDWLADGGVHMIAAGRDRWELRGSAGG